MNTYLQLLIRYPCNYYYIIVFINYHYILIITTCLQLFIRRRCHHYYAILLIDYQYIQIITTYLQLFIHPCNHVPSNGLAVSEVRTYNDAQEIIVNM